MRETDESRADLLAAGQDLEFAARAVKTALDCAAQDGIRADALQHVRNMASIVRSMVDRAEAQLLARIPSVRP